jgi:NAD+-dependent protein deacetylase SIR2
LYCDKKGCGAPVKPDIVFFGESLPKKFEEELNPHRLSKVDVVFIMGTALAVSPFNVIPHLVKNKP